MANKHSILCLQPLYTKIESEDVDLGNVVLRVQAYDEDENGLINSKITYSLTGYGATDFAIDKVRGK